MVGSLGAGGGGTRENRGTIAGGGRKREDKVIDRGRKV